MHLKLTQAPDASPESALRPSAQDAEPTMISTPAKPLPPQPVNSPPPITTTRHLRELPSSFLGKNRAFSTSLASVLQQRPIRPSENKSYTVSGSRDDVHNWDILDGLHPISNPDNASSDTSSVSDDADISGKHREPCWDPDTGRWETYADNSAWSDSDGTIEDVQTTSQGSRFHPFDNKAPERSTIFAPKTYPADASSANGPLPPSRTEQKHPRPRTNERCRNWLRNGCERGYQCNFIHEDLEYDDPPVSFDRSLYGHLFILAFHQEPRRYLESFSTVLHGHIKFKLRAGFDVEDIVTGFESPWIFIGNLPNHISDNILSKLLHPFGEVLEIRRPTNVTSPLTVKVHFANPPDAYRAFTSLHGTTEFGSKLDLRMGLDLDNKGTLIKDSAIRIDWEAPHRTWYVGFASQELAEQALRMMQNTPYCDFLPTASFHTALPAVSVATIKMRFLPVDVEEQGLKVFGPLKGLMSERSSCQDYTVQDTIDGVQRLLSRFQTKMIDFEVRPPPYKEAKMRAWAYFTTPADAKAAAEYLHNRKPQFTGHTRIIARHIKTITFMVSVVKFRRVATPIQSLAESIWKQGAGYSLSVLDKVSYFCLKLCGEDLKLLGRLKAEVEKILNGEALMKDGKTAWDDFFGRHAGILFLQDLEHAYTGVSIEKDTTRRKIRLFGVAEKRLIIREKILEKMEQLRVQKFCFIPLDGLLLAAFLNGELASLRGKLGLENIVLDLGSHALRLRGDEKVFDAARDAVELARKKYKIRRNRQTITVECPVCFDEVSSPIKMPCGHSWCRACLRNYLTAAIEQKIFPLTCLGNEARCTERISLYAAKEVLTAAEFDATVSAAFDTYVQTHPEELHYCPTPDCPQVFRPAPEGIFLQCPSCLMRICPTCKTDAHDGLTCAESKGGDSLFKEWADQRDLKRCPGCQIAIEKDEGCNHMKCTVCQTHICWMCMKTFPGGDGIYGHMRSEHGGFGLGPII